MKMNGNSFCKLVISALFAVVVITSASCGFYFRSRLYEEHDIVKNSLRFRQEFYFNEVVERRTPFLGLHKTMLREVDADGTEILKVYDRLSLALGSFKPKNTVYLIIDGQVFSCESIDAEQDVLSNISEDKKDVLTADSTKVSVVTGYSSSQSRLIRYSYFISPEVISKMQNAESIAFRYYAGPSMMTVTVGPANLKNIKKLLRA
ncbi:MAG TPA: hypothetical protein PKE03_07855 [Bacteroidales bacterium]|nr:hypothetical protein [Bacteroidales bacterium]